MVEITKEFLLSIGLREKTASAAMRKLERHQKKAGAKIKKARTAHAVEKPWKDDGIDKLPGDDDDDDDPGFFDDYTNEHENVERKK